MKPGLQYFGQKFLDTITLGSTTMKDNAYLAAALDQTAVPAALAYEILLVAIVVGAVTMSALNFLLKARLLKSKISTEPAGVDRKDSDTVQVVSQNGGASSSQAGRTTRIPLVIERIVLTSLVLSIVFVSVQSLIHNQSLLIWRSFHADLRQCAPYMTPDEEELIEAQYAAMKSKSDYAIILGRFQGIAEQHNLKLHSSRLW